MWRRSYDVPPDPLAIDDPNSGIDERYADLPDELLPRAECLKDVLERMLPWWDDAIVPICAPAPPCSWLTRKLPTRS